ncbi:MAG: addiction module killer protein [Leptothrix sp. (in: Bacteria)]|nr:addiction module killer protein [Leptothrix sp. (in: b-proteobacteria)]
MTAACTALSRPARRAPLLLRRHRLALAFAGLGLVAWTPALATDAAMAQQSIVVTATRHAMLETTAPAALSVVTRRQIEARGADNLLDALRGETGVSLQGRAIGGRKVLSLRGMDSKHTLFLVDGRRVGASDGVIGHSDFQYDWIAVEDIERIEVVRGPMSVLYGSEALGGVVNVITREPGEAWRGSASVEGSRAEGGRGGDGRRLALRADGPLGLGSGLFLRAGAAATRLDALASAGDPLISELEGREKDDAWLGLAWRGQGQRVDFEHRAGREQRDAGARERSGRRRYHDTVNHLERALTSVGWETAWTGAAGLPAGTGQLRAYRSRIDVENQRSAGVAVNPPQQIDDRVLEGQARLSLGAHALTAGFEVRDEALADPGLPDGLSVSRSRALFVQDELALTPRFGLALGLRHDRYRLFGHEWSPRLYGVWRVDAAWTVKGGYSHGFKAPNLKQIVPGGRAEGPNTFLGNPALQPERSLGVELGVGHTAGATQAQLMLFDQRVDDLIEVRLVAAGAVPGVGTYTYENLARARLRGAEASLAQVLGRGFALQLSYAYLDARTAAGQRLDKRPRHSATLRLDWQGGPWRAGGHVETSTDQQLPALTAGAAPQTVGAVTLVGAQVTRNLPRGLELALGVHNLGRMRLAETSPLFTHVEPPRSWRLTLRGRW